MKDRKKLSGNFCIGNIECVRVKRYNGFSFSYPDGRRKDGFIYIDKGKIDYDFALSELGCTELCEGDLIFVPRGYEYTAHYKCDGTAITIVQFDLVLGELPEALAKPTRLFIPDVARLINEVITHPDSTELGDGRAMYATAKVYELLWKSITALRSSENKLLASKLAPAISDLMINYDKQHPISHYASLCFMSETSFRRAFHEYTGTSPIEYRNKLRIEEADRLIRSNEYSIREAAESVGFSNISFFHRVYKSHLGHTPGDGKR
jgi:AraC-like DNA-binding protein